MADSGNHERKPKPNTHRKKLALRQTWCCSSGIPDSPENFGSRNPKSPSRKSEFDHDRTKSELQKPGGSPAHNNKLGLGIIDRYRTCSPGRVSPIDSETNLDQLPESFPENVSVVDAAVPEDLPVSVEALPESSQVSGFCRPMDETRVCDVKLSLKSKTGSCVVLDLHSDVLSANSSFFAMKLLDSRRISCSSAKYWIEVSDVSDLEIYRGTIELMYTENIVGDLMKAGVPRSIHILEVSSAIMFEIGIKSCFHYLEAVPWSEQEEEKLKNLFARCKFDESTAQGVSVRLYPQEKSKARNLTMQLLRSVTEGSDDKARMQLRFLLKSLLAKSSVYQKDPACLNKDDLYTLCHSCLDLLMGVFVEATSSTPEAGILKETAGPLIGRISKQVDNLSWLLEILIEWQIAEEFVSIWANQSELARMHGETSPMVRYEVSRISASVFLALGKGRVQCEGAVRCGVICTWFRQMLMDFGWIQRCSKGLDVRVLEEAMGQTLLTLPLKQQQSLFLWWFDCFSEHGSECPNLSKAFEVWWRRSFLRAWDFKSG